MKSVKGYFTVEAAMLMPIILSAFIMVIYLFVYQYNRCVLEQELGLAVLYAADVWQDGNGSAGEVSFYLNERGMDKYIVWKMDEFNVNQKNNAVVGFAKGSFSLPIPEWNYWNHKNIWEAEYSCNVGIGSPITFLRLQHKWKGWLTE